MKTRIEVTANSTIVRSTRVASRLFEGSMLVITAHDSILHKFNEVGTFIWQLLDTPKTISEIAESIISHFIQVHETELYAQLCSFITALEQKQLVTITTKELV